jgi:peroxiredoxin
MIFEYPKWNYIRLFKVLLKLTSEIMKNIFYSGLIIMVLALLLSMKSSIQKKAPDFTLKDISGKSVSLSDFKGKVVYLDIWATWCMPCMAEMGKSKKLKEHFKDNDKIVFLYISIDKDEDRWKEVVKKKDIKGVHLISRGGDEAGILQKYDVPSIPRYVLIDKEGNVVEWNAKWPSDPEAKEDIEKLLGK